MPVLSYLTIISETADVQRKSGHLHTVKLIFVSLYAAVFRDFCVLTTTMCFDPVFH